MARRTRWCVAMAALLGFLAGTPRAARADLVFGNLPSSQSFYVSLGADGSYAMGFTTTMAETVDSAEVVLATTGGVTGVTLEIVNDSGGKPGSTSYGTLTYNSVSSGVYTFTGSQVSLMASTNYWLVLALGSNASSLNWESNGYNSTTMLYGTAPSGMGATTVSGTKMGSTYVGGMLGSGSSLSSTSWSADNVLTSYQLNFAADTATAPEPSTFVMVSSTALLGAGFAVRRRRRTNAG